jgi:hypothetical protein
MFSSSKRCPYCWKQLPTAAGVHRHIGQNPACQIKSRGENPKANITPEAAAAAELQVKILESTTHEATTSGTNRMGVQNGSDGNVDIDVPLPAFVPESAQAPRPSRRATVTVEEVEDEGEEMAAGGSRQRFYEAFDGSPAAGLGEGTTIFEDLRQAQKAAGEHVHAPFVNEDEWNLAKWLMQNAGRGAIDEFLKLNKVRKVSSIRQLSLTKM